MPRGRPFAVPKLKTAIAIGQGGAFQGVAQSTAAAVADATQYLQAITVVSSAAIATMTTGMLAQIAAGGGPDSPDQYQSGLTAVQQNVEKTASVYEKIGTSAAAVLTAFKKV